MNARARDRTIRTVAAVFCASECISASSAAHWGASLPTRIASIYTVRWKAGEQLWRRSFRIAAQAEVFRAELLAAARKGEAFSSATGEPVSWHRDEPGTSWYDFTCRYVNMKWNTASAKYRRAIAQALAARRP